MEKITAIVPKIPNHFKVYKTRIYSFVRCFQFVVPFAGSEKLFKKLDQNLKIC
jgi:hypothetical protein